MQYFIAFLEGIITFISPCLLPMLPIYISYLAGNQEMGKRTTVKNSIGFVVGFTILFVAMGAFAGKIGSFFIEYQAILNIVLGAIVIFFGLSFLGVFGTYFFKGMKPLKRKGHMRFGSAMIFGAVFSISWTPCVGVFLGSALAMASQQGTAIAGTIMLLLYSLGLGIPFVLSAVLMESFKESFGWIKKNYKFINFAAGSLLILVGIAMMTGLMNKLLGLLG